MEDLSYDEIHLLAVLVLQRTDAHAFDPERNEERVLLASLYKKLITALLKADR